MWRKLHLGVDSDTGEITAVTLTDNGDIQPRRASERMKRVQETPTFENGSDPSLAAMGVM
jgi:hypothetical protein